MSKERVYKGWPLGGEGRSPVGRAAWRDASWLHSHGRARRYHMVAEDGGASCNGMMLILEDNEHPPRDATRDPADIEQHLRCRRHGCKERWP